MNHTVEGRASSPVQPGEDARLSTGKLDRQQ